MVNDDLNPNPVEPAVTPETTPEVAPETAPEETPEASAPEVDASATEEPTA